MEEGVGAFEDFFSEQMRDELMQLAHSYPMQKSVEVDWEKFSRSNEEQALSLLETPDEATRSAEEAVKRICQSLRPSEGKFEPHVRFYNLPSSSEVAVQFLGAEHLNRLSRVDGVVRWINQISPLMKTATWECVHCTTTMKTESDKANIKPPSLCKCGHKDFRLVEESSEFINVQKAQLQESVEKLRGNAPAADIELWMEDDLTNTIMPGEKVVVTGILRLRQMRDKAGKRSGVYAKFLDVKHMLKQEQEFEELHITKEEEKEILRLSKDPRLFEKIVQSIAPNISGYTEMKQAIALQLFGGTPGKVLPDGRKLRSDIHLLLIGDPGCLVGDERVALGNGALVKMQDFGERHLQQISEQVLTGQGYARDTATVFHRYENQPIMEIVTESGKSIKGTYNHPLLVVRGMKREWKRLDEIKEGDRLAVTTKIPCTITAPIPTDWQPLPRRLGPRSKAVLPQKLDKELAALLGYIAGDGWVTRTCVAFDVNSEEEDLIPVLCAVAENKFGIAPKIRREHRPAGRTQRRASYKRAPGKKPINVVEIYSVDVAHSLLFLRQKRVPDLVMRSGNAVAAEFLAWLFEADGCVFGKGRGRRAVQLKSSEIEMLRDVQTLLLRFGIHSRIVGNNLGIKRAESIRKFAEKIGFRSAKKKARLAGLVASVKNLHHECGGQRSERVVLVRAAGFADVFDIEIPKGHRFITNGVVSHNTGKSATLQYVSNLAPKSVYVSGASSSGVGLTASAEKEKDGEGWILKAGAMVLANGGLALIDEFDKMGDEDRGALHEAMEQQRISIAKAGIVTQFQSRTSVLAAANPKAGFFDPTTPIPMQFNIQPALVSRFDLIFAIRDELDESRDRRVAGHILAGHKLAGEKAEPPEDSPLKPSINTELLRKYIAYARRNHFPALSDDAIAKIENFYVEMRRAGKGQGTVAITPRNVEAAVRLAEASARMRLGDTVDAGDADRAIGLMDFFMRAVYTDKETGGLDSYMVSVGDTKKHQTQKMDRIKTVLNLIYELERETDLVEKAELESRARELGIDKITAEKIIDDLKRGGDLYEPKAGFVKSARRKE
ncbi:hypothetical protein COT29_02910 [Candidatus Micrarchaeota archaeon CG08_land_8_20_14_0_20_59_11]|nr:MAG: hypothetical protein COT29_02910 [Candidatus Micrarchaeota archaeon CG08_land_8_20_14_0_20_59_11]